MGKDKLIKPIYKTGFGKCRHCNGPIIVLNTESILFSLDEDGFPVKQQGIYNNTRALCQKCGETFNMIQTNFGFIPDSPITNMTMNKNKEVPSVEKDNNPFLKAVLNGMKGV